MSNLQDELSRLRSTLRDFQSLNQQLNNVLTLLDFKAGFPSKAEKTTTQVEAPRAFLDDLVSINDSLSQELDRLHLNTNALRSIYASEGADAKLG